MLFSRDHRIGTDRQRKTYALFEIAYTLVDFVAALCFVVGSVMFFSEAWQTPGTWLFLIGSICFALKPTLRLVRELKLAAMGDDKDLANRFNGD
jgi:hypothetical protein